ncbi:Bud site selection protein 20 [Orbilia blumenaviensis]|uniref:Bud site selection protein 20 n=1 Tax=Orbilia blumenaviensis TaxID=1796055 RepID=A0AAV9VMF6_9PEZI
MGPQRLRKTRNRTRDLDQISTDLLHPRRLEQHLSTLPLEDLPALGQLYCAPCARFLESQHALSHHQRSKTHKKRLKLLREPAYSHEEANAAIGQGIDNGSSVSSLRVNPEEVISRVSRDRILALKKTTAAATAESMSLGSEMDVEADHQLLQQHQEVPQLVEQQLYPDDDADL